VEPDVPDRVETPVGVVMPVAELLPPPPPEPTPAAPEDVSWFSSNLRNIIALALTLVVIYLAIMGDTTAQASIIAAFSVLVGAIWGERSSLKIPGRNR
jgi:hypothetical protein